MLAAFSLSAQTPLKLAPEELALMQAAHDGQLDEVERIVAAGVDVDVADSDYRTPVMFAAFNGHSAVVAFLHEHGAVINTKDINGRTPLLYASSGPFPGTVDYLLKNGAEVDIQGTLEGFTALMTAAAEGQVDVVRVLLEHGADKDLEDKDGDTALSFARQNGHSEVIELLTGQ